MSDVDSPICWRVRGREGNRLTRGGVAAVRTIERSEAGGRYGTWPFEFGLWVGKAATPNILGRKGDGRPDSARAKVNAFKRNPDRNASPVPLENCPWCQTRFEPESFTLLPDADNARELRIVCTDFECAFSGDRPLPVVGVDEPIYRRLPAFLIATVDKFASLPWVGQAGALLGGADRVGNSLKVGGVPNGIRTRVSALKGLDPRPLDDGDVRGCRTEKYTRRSTRPGGGATARI